MIGRRAARTKGADTFVSTYAPTTILKNICRATEALIDGPTVLTNGEKATFARNRPVEYTLEFLSMNMRAIRHRFADSPEDVSHETAQLRGAQWLMQYRIGGYPGHAQRVYIGVRRR